MKFSIDPKSINCGGGGGGVFGLMTGILPFKLLIGFPIKIHEGVALLLWIQNEQV